MDTPEDTVFVTVEDTETTAEDTPVAALLTSSPGTYNILNYNSAPPFWLSLTFLKRLIFC